MSGQKKYDYKRVTFYFNERRYEVVGKTPAEAYDKKARKLLHRSLTPDERAAFLEFCPLHRAEPWVKVMLYCGPRPNETIALDWRHVDFKNSVLNVQVAMKARTKTNLAKLGL
ncbi:MAG: tyrosine-type recombinase/integrase [Christensenellaceae bacterium]|jgi:integrase|nr:tyrosine-type recombinase/integrase [Christensenellaceae bacterium]